MLQSLPSSTTLLNELHDLLDWADEVLICVAWASGASSGAPHWKALDLTKVTRALVGLDFYHTEPEALRRLLARPGRLRVIQDTEGTFHPKIVIGKQNQLVRAIIGSSNFTVGGYSGNTEFNIALEGSVADPVIENILNFIDAQWVRPESWEPTPDEIDEYERRWRTARRTARRPRRTQKPLGPPVNANLPTVLTASWGEYVRLILDQEGRTSTNGDMIRVQGRNSYLAEAKACRRTWSNAQSFSTLSRSRRELLAGYGRRSTGYFGRMSNSPPFTHSMRVSTTDIGAQVDRVPATGPMTTHLLQDVMDGLMDIHGIAFGVTTRLLTACRPDLFFPVNGANISRVQDLFGEFRNVSAVHCVSDYLSALERVWSTPWYLSPIPDRGLQRRIWRARAAMLDALLYEAVNAAP